MSDLGIYSSTSGAFTRPANTTAYAAGDIVGTNIAITAASNASPIVITAASHGLSVGDVVTIASVGGNTAANGTFRVSSVVSSSQFTLQSSAGNGAYTSGGTIARWLRIPNAARVGGSGAIRQWEVLSSGEPNANKQFSLLVYRGAINGGLPPNATLDNAAWNVNVFTDRSLFIAKTATATVTATQYGLTGSFTGASNTYIPFDLQGTSQDLYVQIMAEAAYTPASAEQFEVALYLEKY